MVTNPLLPINHYLYSYNPYRVLYGRVWPRVSQIAETSITVLEHLMAHTLLYIPRAKADKALGDEDAYKMHVSQWLQFIQNECHFFPTLVLYIIILLN